jgi:hypothetical protein
MFAEQVLHKLRGVVMRRDVRKHQETHEGRPVGSKEFQRLMVGQVPVVTPDPFFQIERITAFF